MLYSHLRSNYAVNSLGSFIKHHPFISAGVGAGAIGMVGMYGLGYRSGQRSGVNPWTGGRYPMAGRNRAKDIDHLRDAGWSQARAERWVNANMYYPQISE